MRKTLIITCLVFLLFLIEFLLYNIIGEYCKPNLLIILVVFINLTLGIRYSIFTAVLAGAIKDSFSFDVFGINMYAFVLCAYATTVLRNYIYVKGSKFSRILMVFFISTFNVLVHYCLYLIFGSISFGEVIQYVLFPEVFLTLICATYVFQKLQKCALKFFV